MRNQLKLENVFNHKYCWLFERFPSLKFLYYFLHENKLERLYTTLSIWKKLLSTTIHESVAVSKIHAKNTWINIEHIKTLFGNWQRKSESGYIEKNSQNNDFSIRCGEIQLRILHMRCNWIQNKKNEVTSPHNNFSHSFLFPLSPETPSHL